MKLAAAAISGTNLYLKLAIFITGIVTGLDSSLRQLLYQFLLFLVYLLLEPRQYLLLLKALRKILLFMSGYWLFATCLSQPFISSVLFTMQVIYMLTVTVVAMGNVPMSQLATDSAGIRRFKPLNALFYYFVATFAYMSSFVRHYNSLKSASSKSPLLTQVVDVVHLVSSDTAKVQSHVRQVLANTSKPHYPFRFANFSAFIFLALLVVIHGI